MRTRELLAIHEEILRLLEQRDSSYAAPVPSVEIALALNVAPSYVRQQIAVLQTMRLVAVRRGRGGGYYLRPPHSGKRRKPRNTDDFRRKHRGAGRRREGHNRPRGSPVTQGAKTHGASLCFAAHDRCE